MYQINLLEIKFTKIKRIELRNAIKHKKKNFFLKFLKNAKKKTNNV